MNLFLKFWHDFKNPHCADCIAEKECNSCHELHEQLVHERNQNRELVRALVELTKPEQVIINQEIEQPKPVSRQIPWHVKRAQLEQEDRQLAETIKKKKEEMNSMVAEGTIEKLEEELGLKDASKIS